MNKPFWARVEMKKWVGRMEVNKQGIITFAPPIAYRWTGLKWMNFIKDAFLKEQLRDFQIFYYEEV